jgi:hypothetical protein
VPRTPTRRRRRARAARRSPRPRPPAQLLAEAGHDQQAVVGPGAEHEDDQDPGRLAVDDEAGAVHEQVDDARGDHVGESHDQQRHERDDRRAVDEEQQDEDKRARREQQRHVDLAEHLDGVDRDPRRPGHPGLEPGRASLGDDAPDPLDRRLDLLDVVGRDRQYGDRGRAVASAPVSPPSPR